MRISNKAFQLAPVAANPKLKLNHRGCRENKRRGINNARSRLSHQRILELAPATAKLKNSVFSVSLSENSVSSVFSVVSISDR
jgi:hypothetical protein